MIITNIPYTFNGNKYLCTVENTSCSLNTIFSTLHVNTTNDITISENNYDKTNLKQNTPNPFSGNTSFDYTINSSGNVKLSLYDIVGNKIKDFQNEYKGIGTYTLVLNSENLKPGVFLFLLEFENDNTKFAKVKKIAREAGHEPSIDQKQQWFNNKQEELNQFAGEVLAWIDNPVIPQDP